MVRNHMFECFNRSEGRDPLSESHIPPLSTGSICCYPSNRKMIVMREHPARLYHGHGKFEHMQGRSKDYRAELFDRHGTLFPFF